jgi:hypothetical protein
VSDLCKAQANRLHIDRLLSVFANFFYWKRNVEQYGLGPAWLQSEINF